MWTSDGKIDILSSSGEIQLSKEDIKNVIIQQEINGDFRLSFDIPLTDESIIEYFNGQNILTVKLPYGIYENELFTVSSTQIKLDGTKILHIEAPHIFLETRNCIVVSVDEMIGRTVDYIVGELWTAAQSYTGNAIESYGLTFTVDDDIAQETIDFEKHENQSFWDCIKDLTDTLGFGEIQIKGTTGKLVRQIDGGSFSAVKVGTNATVIEVNRDFSSIVTRAYIYGKDNLDLTSIISKPYIESSNITVYGAKEKSYEFSEISDVITLLSRGQWLFDEENPERVDVPAETISLSLENMAFIDESVNPYRLGGTVPVSGGYVQNNPLRIVSLSYYLFEPQNVSVTLGRMQTDLWQYLKRINSNDRRTKKIVQTQIKSGETYSEIETVTKETVLASEVIETTAAFSENLFTDYLETNILNFKCTPNLKMEDGKPVWDYEGEEETHYYTCANTKSLRGFIVAEGIHLYFKEQQLVAVDNYEKLTESAVTEFKVNGRQLYYTSILGGANPYEFFTFTDPKSKYDDMTDSNAEMFKVYIRKAAAEFIKAQLEFTEIENEVYGTTYDIRLLFGTGLNDGTDKGKAIVKKDNNGFYFSYVGRTDGVERGIYIDDDTNMIRGNEKIPLLVAHKVTELPETFKEGDLYFLIPE